MPAVVDFPTDGERELAFLLSDHGFAAVSEDEHVVRWQSPTIGLRAVWDPRGEVSVSLFLRELGEPAYGWDYTGMVGRASVTRLLQLAAETMKADPGVLAGDVEYYARLDADKRRTSREWTAYYSRKGPRPKTGLLP